LKRNQQKASSKRNSADLSQCDAANSTFGNSSTAAVEDNFPAHESEEELRKKHDFDVRRQFFKSNHKLSLAKLLEKTPYYEDFQKVLNARLTISL
jgi:hypothetical protein